MSKAQSILYSCYGEIDLFNTFVASCSQFAKRLRQLSPSCFVGSAEICHTIAPYTFRRHLPKKYCM